MRWAPCCGLPLLLLPPLFRVVSPTSKCLCLVSRSDSCAETAVQKFKMREAAAQELGLQAETALQAG